MTLFRNQKGKPQYQNDSKVFERLRVVSPGSVTSKDVIDLAMLLIRYQYATDLEQIAEGWGFTLNSLLASARNHWERGDYVSSDTEATGSSWDATAND